MQQGAAGHAVSSGREPPDLYELLEISPRASQDVVQAAYRALVRNFHPDRNESVQAAQRIRELNEAYRVLSDPEGRARYDLDRARRRRHERIAQSDTTRGEAPTPAPRMRALAVRPAPRARPAEERGVILNGHVLLGLLLILVLASMLIFGVWFSMELGTDSTPPYEPQFELVRY
jgi:curved DNA-binding protein CbpA